MIVIGERINSTRKSIAKAIEEKDVGFLQKEALKQVEAGADYVDVNAGIFIEKEAEYLEWLVQIVQEVTDKPLCIDSPNPQALASALRVYKGKPIINNKSEGIITSHGIWSNIAPAKSLLLIQLYALINIPQYS